MHTVHSRFSYRYSVVICFVVVILVLAGLSAIKPMRVAHATGPLYAAPVASGTGDCSSWANACTLQTALTGAVSGDEIWAAAGTHKPTTDGTNRYATFQLKNGVALYGGFAGTETARDQRNPAVNATILSGDIDNNDSQTPIITDLTTVTGNNTNSYQVVIGATGATLDGFTITAGYASGPSTANYGGGMYNATSDPIVADVKFSGNWAGYGGGMFNDFGSKPMLTDVIFNHNSATIQGGGLFSQGASSPALVNVTFTGNSSNQGGGMFNHNGSNATLEDVTFSSNTAGWGGGMYNQVISTPTLTNVTFSGNSATNYGGGMYNDSSSNLQIRNTVFWSNTAPSGGAQIHNNNSTPSVSDSVVQGGCPAGSICTNIITADPLLGTLGNYGGSTQTIPLLPGSSAIDATSTNCPATDQRGIARGTTCDIGAFESQGFTLTKTSGDNQTTAINTAFTNPLALSVTSAYGEPVSGGQVILTAPSSGASIATTLITLTIASGAVSQSVTANSTTGTYSVTASTSGASSTIFNLTNNNPVPTLATLNPASAKAGGVGFTLVVTGTNFITGSTVRWNGSDRVTTFVSATQLTATIPASDIATIGTANVAVFNPTPGSGTSNSLVFTIGQATTNLVLISSPNPSFVGNTVTFTATLMQNNTLARPNSRAPSDVTPTGIVTFTLDATTNVTRTMNASGVTTYTTSSLAVGAHTIVATYGGDANLVGAISNTVTQNVKAKLFLPLILR